MSAPSSASSLRCTFTLTKNVAVPAAIHFRSISMAVAKISASGGPTNVVFPPHRSTYWLPSTMIGCHTNIATAPLSESHEAAVKTLPIQADLSWSPLPLVPLCTDAFSVSSQLIVSSSHFAFFVWTVTCRHLALKPIASEHAYLCAHSVSNRVLYLSIALDIRLFGLMLRPLSSKLFFSRLPRGNLGDPARSILFAHCTFDVVLSSLRFLAHWLPFASSLICLLSCFGLCLLAAVWEDFFPSTSNGRYCSSFSLGLHQTT